LQAVELCAIAIRDMATLQELQTRLADAESALHNVLIGRGVSEVRDFNGEMVRYSRVDTAALRAYIKQLQDEIAVLLGTPNVSGPMRPFFL
jgi:hypothetical protein